MKPISSFAIFSLFLLLNFPTYGNENIPIRYPAQCWQSEDGKWHFEIEFPAFDGHISGKIIKHEFFCDYLIHSQNCSCEWWLCDF